MCEGAARGRCAKTVIGRLDIGARFCHCPRPTEPAARRAVVEKANPPP